MVVLLLHQNQVRFHKIIYCIIILFNKFCVNNCFYQPLSGLPSLVQLVATQENGDLQSKSLSMRSLTNNSYLQARNAISHPDIRTKSPEIPLAESRYKWWESQEVNLGSSVNIFNEVENIKKSKEIVDEINEKKADSKTYFDNFVDFFDLTLLRDPIFVNILLGLSIAACVETNFTLLLPIILKDMLQFETSDIAKIMSVIGFSDSFFRILAPFIGEWCHKPPRVMYIVSLLMIIFVRCSKYSSFLLIIFTINK